MSLLNAEFSKPTKGGPSFTFKHRLIRLTWRLAWSLLASWTPEPFHLWRIFILRAFGAKVAGTAHVYSSAQIWYPANLKMGAYSCLGPRSICYCMAAVYIGPGVTISQGAHLCTGSHSIDDPGFQLYVKPIEIHENAWVAAEAFVGPGVTVGSGCVIGARAVLFRNTEPNGVYIGNPATLIRGRRIFGEGI